MGASVAGEQGRLTAMAVADLARQNQPWIVAIRRDLHRDPELSFQEARTSARIVRELDALGIPYERVGEYGLIATITGTRRDRAVALRADMDALPILEETENLPFASENPGVMHACGHDGHVAMLLGAARILQGMRQEIGGTVKLCFQQAEEVGKGATEMVDALKASPVVAVFGIHLWSELETGKISIEPGPRMAAASAVEIAVRGTGTHGAYPHRGADPVLGASAIVMNLAALMSREADPVRPSVLTFGVIAGGEARNIIPEIVRLKGSLRTTDDAHRAELRAAIERVVRETGATWRTPAELEWVGGAPLVANDPEASAIARRAALAVTDEADIVRLDTLMASENFGEFLQAWPGVFAFLGVRNEAVGAVYPHHHPKFAIDEAPLWKGAALHAQFAIERLAQQD